MNQGLRRLFILLLGLFAILIGATARWTVFEADELNANARNARPLLQTAKVPRGTITAADGTLLARSVKQSDGTYVRRYTAAAREAAHLVGYAFIDGSRSGMEKEYQDELSGKVASAATLLSSLRGDSERGNDVVAALEPDVQRAAIAGLAGKRGAAIAIDVKSGGVIAMRSNPGFDPNDMGSGTGRTKINNTPGSPLFNRVTQASYAPGSTFKVVTTSSALGSGKYTPTTMVDGSSPYVVETKELNNFGNVSYGDITLTEALTKSVNTAFARVAEDIGPETLGATMDRYGFYDVPKIDYPEDQLNRSGLYDREDQKWIPVDDDVDIARVGIGQERLSVTPLQMGLVAAAVARGGTVPVLSTVQRIVDPDGRTLKRLGNGSSAGRVMSERDAAELTDMMKRVVNEGTGTAAALQGLQVAGKTGTAERVIEQNITQPWFIGFAPADNPRVAVAVTIEAMVDGTGGVNAAPIAKAMMEAAL